MIYPGGTGFIDDNQPSGTIQPDTKEAVLGTVPEYINDGIDYCSGRPMEVLEKGTCSENNLGDTAPQPLTFDIVDYQDSKNNVGG